MGQRVNRDDARALGTALAHALSRREADPVGWVALLDEPEGPVDRRLLVQAMSGWVIVRRTLDCAPGGSDVLNELAAWLQGVAGDPELHLGWGECEPTLSAWPAYLRQQVSGWGAGAV